MGQLKSSIDDFAFCMETNQDFDPPATTDFGVMFVPTESLYAEILRIPGFSDSIRQKYNISIVSPSTLPALLSSLTMGFRSVAIEKRSAEVWQTLGAVKTQFSRSAICLPPLVRNSEETANKIGSAEVTSRQIERKLKSVESLPETDSIKLIGEVKIESNNNRGINKLWHVLKNMLE